MADQRIPGPLPGPQRSFEGHPTSAPGGRSPGSPAARCSIPGPIGLELEPLPLQSGTKGISNPSPAVERTLIGEYKNPWESNPAQEIAMIQAGSNPQSGKHWSPGTVDFQALSQSTLLANSYPSFLAWLLKEKPGSLKRVNIITHGDFSRIGFKGAIDVRNGDVSFDSIVLKKSVAAA